MRYPRAFSIPCTVRTRAVIAAILTYVSTLPAPAQTSGTVGPGTTVTINSDPTLTQNWTIAPITQPASSTQIVMWNPSMVPKGPGTMLCSDAGTTGSCGTIDADYVGAYKLNMSCSSGFYDPIYGGSCWQCPANDSAGNNWLRQSGNAVTADDACWRVPYEQTTSATFDGLGWAWNCTGNQFWDEHDQNGNWIYWGGACWNCPDAYPRRTANAINGNAACATPTQQTAPAQMLNYSGCPTPNETTMYPNKSITDKRTPGHPFLDIASGLSVANDAGGACWACPVVDTPGNFMVTYRNGNTLIGKPTGNSGCEIQYKYQPPVFPEPGLAGLDGVKDILFENQILTRPNDLTTYMYGLAAAANITGAAAKTWVTQQWADMVQHPYMNSVIRTLVFQYLGHGAPVNMYLNGKGPTSKTAAETKLVNSFQAYVQARRTYLAQQGLNMYDAWYNSTVQYRQSHMESLDQLFYYGTVPLDFQGLLTSIGAISATGLGVIGSVVAANIFASQVEFLWDTQGLQWVATRTTELFGLTDGIEFFTSGLSSVGAAGGPLIIAAVGAILSTIAMNQLMEILTARDKLVASLQSAQQPVVLSTLTGDQGIYYWGLATSVASENEDPQIVALAKAANNVASQNNYTKPQ